MSGLGAVMELPGPVGERNTYALHSRGSINLYPKTRAGLFAQMAAVLASGNRGSVKGMALPEGLPPEVMQDFVGASGPASVELVEGGTGHVRDVLAAAAAAPGAIRTVYAADGGARLPYPIDALLEEVSTSVNTTAAGGNAQLMMIG